MIHLPDLRPLFGLALFGLFCAALLVGAGVGWLGWHLFHALALSISEARDAARRQ